MKRNWIRTFALAAGLLGVCVAAGAQGMPGGMGGERMRGGGRLGERGGEGTMRQPEMNLRAHPLALLAAALQAEAPTLASNGPAADALAAFVRELRDFAALDDRIARERTGINRATVRATVDLQRDIGELADAARERATVAADVQARWKALRDKLDETARQRVEGIYANALRDSVAPVEMRRRPGSPG